MSMSANRYSINGRCRNCNVTTRAKPSGLVLVCHVCRRVVKANPTYKVKQKAGV